MSIAEIMTIIISFHQSHYRDFKNYYLGYVAKNLKSHFPSLLSYTRFIEVIPSVIIPLNAYIPMASPIKSILNIVGINYIWNNYWVTHFVPNIKKCFL